MIDATIRTAVWDGRFQADRLQRYYGELADKMAKRDRIAAVCTTVGAMCGMAFTMSSFARFTWLPILGTIVCSLWPLLYRAGGRLRSTASCHTRLSQIYVEFDSLWLGIEADSASDDHSVRESLMLLTSRMDEATAQMAETGTYDKKLSGQVEKQAYRYWEAETQKRRLTAAST